MDKILEQKAIDSLFAGGTATEPGADGLGDTAAYNFGSAGQISNEQMRAISAVNDQFARNLSHTSGAWLRTGVHTVLAASEQLSFSDFLSCLPETAYVRTLQLEPLGGAGLLELDLKLAFTMIDLLLGGRGTAETVRDVTDIEDSILESFLAVLLRELNSAWQSVGLLFALNKGELQSRGLRVMPPAERALCLSFELQILEVRGMLNFCLPAVMLNAVHRRLTAAPRAPGARFAGASERVALLMRGARATAVMRTPVVRISSAQLGALEPGALLELPLPRHTPAELLLGNVRLASALPVASGDHRGALLQAAARGMAKISAVEEGTGVSGTEATGAINDPTVATGGPA